MEVAFELLPLDFADKNINGKGREAPNNFPVLDPPKGRLSFSLNPFTMLKMILGPEVANKCCCCLCTIILIVVGAYLGFSFATTGLVTKLLG